MASLPCVRTLGGIDSAPPMQFRFCAEDWDGSGDSGHLAFSQSLLLVTDAGHDTVHVIDVDAGVHVGYVTAPGTIAGPRGVAARGSLAAVSAWKEGDRGDHAVHLLEGGGASWTRLRVVGGGFGGPGDADGQLNWPYGLRFATGGAELAVTDSWNGRVSVFRVEDGSFVRQLATGLSVPYDVEECEGGWLVACQGSCTIECVSGAWSRTRLGKYGEVSSPAGLARVLGLGVVVRENGVFGGGVRVFCSPDEIAMASMSAVRVGWMVAVVRGAQAVAAPPRGAR